MSWSIIPSEAVTALAALLGAAFGAFLTHRFNRNRDHIELKRDVLRRLLGYRWQLSSGQHSPGGEVFTALNEISVVFAGDKEVEDALRAFYEAVQGGFRPDDFRRLARAMAKSARVPYDGWFSDLIESPFTPGRQGN